MWFDGRLDLDPDRLVFFDDTGATTKMARPCGRSACGERCRANLRAFVDRLACRKCGQPPYAVSRYREKEVHGGASKTETLSLIENGKAT